MPDRDRHANKVELIRSRFKLYIEYFAKLEAEPVEFLLRSIDEAQIHYHQILQTTTIVLAEHKRTLEDYQHWFELVLNLYSFVDEISCTDFALLRAAFSEDRSVNLIAVINKHIDKLNAQFSRGLPIGLEVSLMSIVQDSLLLGDFFENTQPVLHDLASVRIPPEAEWTFDMFDQQIPDRLMSLKLQNMIHLMSISDGNAKLREFLLDRQFNIFKEHLLKEMKSRE